MSFSRWFNKRHDKQPQGLSRQQRGPASRQAGQNMTEYMLVFAAAVAVMVVALNPKGFVTKAVSKSINMMFDSVEDMTREPCLGTIDDVNGGWSGWSSWGACAGCVQTRTRGCTNPSPKCNGSPCSGPATETQTCLSGTWVTGICGACTGDCGDTTGTCTRLVTCLGGCCTSPAPASVLTCTKAEYPDEWKEFGFVGSCSTTCGQGIASQTVQCSGMCCDAKIKPHTRRACTDGCCAESLYIGMDVGAPMSDSSDDTPMYADFGPAGPGPFPMPCPPGYVGTPTYTCTATANLICTGNDSYVPPASCYSIGWGGFSGECQPGDCGQSSPVDIGYGGYTLMYQFGGANNGGTATVDCTTLTNPVTGAGHTAYLGQLASYDCWLESWLNLNATCIPNCPQEDNVFIGEDLYETFPETWDDTTATLICSSYDEVPAGLGTKKYVGSVTRDCGIFPLSDGQWGSVNGTCSFKPCPTATYSDGNAVVSCEFSASAHSSTPVTLDCATCSPGGDTRYTGSFSRTCTYGDWMYPSGSCTAAPCSDWTTTSNGVNITFWGTGHDATQSATCTDTAAVCSTNTCSNVQAKCCFGQWFDTLTDCGTVASVNWANNAYSGICRTYQCQITYVSPPVANASSCGDDSNLYEDEDWSVVDDCTSTKTCEWACDSGYVKKGNACKAAECTGSGFSLAVTCPNQSPLVDTPRTLVDWVTNCTGAPCEYYCQDIDYRIYNAVCCDPYTCGDINLCGGPYEYNDNCGGKIYCQGCCGNGAIDSGEVCDKNGPQLNGKTCADFGYTGNCGSLGCSTNCTSFDTSNCKNKVDGTWGGSWVDVGGCNSTCQQLQQQQTCVGASCGGTCSGSYPEQYVTCSNCCPNGTCDSGETCSTCSADCEACGPVCGNNTCESGEECSSSTPCPADCGTLRWKDLGKLCGGKYCGYAIGNGTCGSGAYQYPWVDRYSPYSPHGDSCSVEGNTCGRALYARYPENAYETYTFQCVRTCDTSHWKNGEK